MLFRDMKCYITINKCFIYNVCAKGDIDFFTEITKNFKINKKHYSEYDIEQMFTHATSTKNIDFIIFLYNYFKFDIGIIFSKQLLSNILFSIFLRYSSMHKEYDNIIYEFINLGGKISGHPVYTDYINSIQIIT